ncbi:Smr/MutS family protein [uncultured Methylophaga sp.]|jgi:DNA-nicking Smr family endonuclease|uniref:Smr/MutS family protein n=1 Tax=uncultured Methylophaga sp. TaxID=285271 RepID=UPI0030F6A127
MSKDKNIDEELELFRAEMSDAEPIKHDKLLHIKPPPQPKVRKHIPSDLVNDQSEFSSLFAPETVGNEEYLEYRGDGIQNRQFAKLKSGRVHLEAELDLHGLTLAKAEPTLSHFLEQCQQEKIRCVRIIHGKGWGSRDNKPVLKSKLNHWLRQSDAVLAFCSATIEDGGTGALYVLLKRQFEK